MSRPAGGGFAELTLASADRAAPMASKVSFAEAAGLVIGGGTAANHDYLRGLGTGQVFDYHAADWIEQVCAAVPGGVDLLFDAAGGQTRDQALGAVRDGGRAIFIVLHSPPPARLERGITRESFAANVGRPRLDALSRLVDSGKLRPQVEAALLLERAREALARVAGGRTRGKIVLRIGP
jgi:NADPH:quinone reductase